MRDPASRTWRLLDAAGRPYASPAPGTLGGHRRGRIYGRLDCPSALRAITRGGYVRDRVFFADEGTAQAAGYRPCAICLPDAYARWKVRAAVEPTDTWSPRALHECPAGRCRSGRRG